MTRVARHRDVWLDRHRPRRRHDRTRRWEHLDWTRPSQLRILDIKVCRWSQIGLFTDGLFWCCTIATRQKMKKGPL